MSNLQEIWKIVPNTEGRYFASSYGRIKSVRVTETGLQLEKLVSLRNTNKGYKAFKSCINGSPHSILAHRYVAAAFFGWPPHPSYVINHLDCNRTNNKPENLEWCTQTDNVKYAYRLNRLDNNGLSNGYSSVFLHMGTGVFFSLSELGVLLNLHPVTLSKRMKKSKYPEYVKV